MKKIITLLIFLFAGVTLAQTYTPYDKTEGRYWRAYKDTLLASYVYVVNDSTSLAYLDSLIADLATSKGYLLNIKNNGDSLIVLVNSTNTKLDDVVTDLDSLVLLTTNIYTAVDNVEAKLDSIDASSTRIEGKIDNTNTKLDSIEVTANNIESKVATSAKQDSIFAELTALATPIATISNATSSLNPMDIYGGGTTTADTSDVDTVFFRQGAVNASTYATLEITTVDSVLELSFDGFTTNIDVVLNSPIKIEKIAVATFPKFYIRKKVATGTANYRYFWYGY